MPPTDSFSPVDFAYDFESLYDDFYPNGITDRRPTLKKNPTPAQFKEYLDHVYDWIQPLFKKNPSDFQFALVLMVLETISNWYIEGNIIPDDVLRRTHYMKALRGFYLDLKKNSFEVKWITSEPKLFRAVINCCWFDELFNITTTRKQLFQQDGKIVDIFYYLNDTTISDPFDITHWDLSDPEQVKSITLQFKRVHRIIKTTSQHLTAETTKKIFYLSARVIHSISLLWNDSEPLRQQYYSFWDSFIAVAHQDSVISFTRVVYGNCRLMSHNPIAYPISFQPWFIRKQIESYKDKPEELEQWYKDPHPDIMPPCQFIANLPLETKIAKIPSVLPHEELFRMFDAVGIDMIYEILFIENDFKHYFDILRAKATIIHPDIQVIIPHAIPRSITYHLFQMEGIDGELYVAPSLFDLKSRLAQEFLGIYLWVLNRIDLFVKRVYRNISMNINNLTNNPYGSKLGKFIIILYKLLETFPLHEIITPIIDYICPTYDPKAINDALTTSLEKDQDKKTIFFKIIGPDGKEFEHILYNNLFPIPIQNMIGATVATVIDQTCFWLRIFSKQSTNTPNSMTDSDNDDETITLTEQDKLNIELRSKDDDYLLRWFIKTLLKHNSLQWYMYYTKSGILLHHLCRLGYEVINLQHELSYDLVEDIAYPTETTIYIDGDDNATIKPTIYQPMVEKIFFYEELIIPTRHFIDISVQLAIYYFKIHTAQIKQPDGTSRSENCPPLVHGTSNIPSLPSIFNFDSDATFLATLPCDTLDMNDFRQIYQQLFIDKFPVQFYEDEILSTTTSNNDDDNSNSEDDEVNTTVVQKNTNKTPTTHPKYNEWKNSINNVDILFRSKYQSFFHKMLWKSYQKSSMMLTGRLLKGYQQFNDIDLPTAFPIPTKPPVFTTFIDMVMLYELFIVNGMDKIDVPNDGETPE